jgi:hypothetical protein
MDDDLAEDEHDLTGSSALDEQSAAEEVARLQGEFQARLIAANLRTEAVRAGMIDLDGLKLINLSAVRLDENDMIIEGRKIMTDLRRAKPWLFGAPSTSSAAVPPLSQPIRPKTAMDMTAEEYTAARTAVTKHHF